ncbi:MAG TPA: recombinase family protein [Gemmatimonadales bacterium]|nr:recombinase family protein [Gemmatimonadales bacterium]
MDSNQQAVAYCRVSTLEQKRQGYGIDIQIRDVTLFAERQGFFIRRFYRDEAESGVAQDRRGLQHLLKDCQAGRVGTVIIPSLDRLSRDVRLAENLFHEFEKCGVQVLIADMPTYNGKDRKDVMIRQIREAIAEENRKEIIERLWKGRQERVRRGLPPGGNAPYGYRRNGGSLELNPIEAVAVKLIFELGDRGEMSSSIARALERKGLARRNGAPWSRRQVSAVLSRSGLYKHGLLRYGEVNGKNENLAIVQEGEGNASRQ